MGSALHTHLWPLGCEQRKRVGLLSGDEARTMLFYTLTAPAQREDSENNEKDALVEGSYGNRKNAAGKEKSRTYYCWKCQHCGLLPRMALKV